MKKLRQTITMTEFQKNADILNSALSLLDERGDDDRVTMAMTIATLAREAIEKNVKIDSRKLYSTATAIFRRDQGRAFADEE